MSTKQKTGFNVGRTGYSYVSKRSTIPRQSLLSPRATLIWNFFTSGVNTQQNLNVADQKQGLLFKAYATHAAIRTEDDGGDGDDDDDDDDDDPNNEN